MRSVVACLLWLVAAEPASLAAQAEPRFDAVRDTIRKLIAEDSVPSIAVAVAKDGRVLWEEGFGWADRERRVAATAHTMYSLASISKPFTATALMTLVERGVIDLAKPANAYLGEGRLTAHEGSAEEATVERLLTHTAGLPLHYQFFYRDAGYAPPPADETIRRYGILVYPPGQRYVYSNLGYGILDQIIARASARSYADFMQAEVFAPLGLARTAVGAPSQPGVVVAVRYDRALRPLADYTFDHVGASAIYASAHDLVRFGMFHLKDQVPGQRQILQQRTIDAMQRSVAAADVPGQSRGLGWAISESDNGYRRVSHTGSMPGVTTILNLYPSEKLAVVVLINRTGPPFAVRVANAIAKIVLPRYAAALAQREARPPGDAEPRPLAPPPELVGRWTGKVTTYQDTIAMAVVVQSDGDVHVQLGDELRTLLNFAAFRDGVLTGRFLGTIRTTDAERHRHNVALSVRLREHRMTGWVSAITTTERPYFALSSWAELSKVQTAETGR